MDYVKLGRTGIDVSRLCLGCMSYGAPDRGAHACVDARTGENRSHVTRFHES